MRFSLIAGINSDYTFIMSSITSPRPFQVGTLGWTAADLDHPDIARQWGLGRYEIIEGVLTDMAAAYFKHGNAVLRLYSQLERQFEGLGIEGEFANELDIIIDEQRVIRADAAFMTPQDQAAQIRAVAEHGRTDPDRSRIYVPPTLIIESVSPDHERHDRVTKRRWYAEFGVPNYWIIDAYRKSLDCLHLVGGVYAVDAAGRDGDVLQPKSFSGISITLQRLWRD